MSGVPSAFAAASARAVIVPGAGRTAGHLVVVPLAGGARVAPRQCHPQATAVTAVVTANRCTPHRGRHLALAGRYLRHGWTIAAAGAAAMVHPCCLPGGHRLAARDGRGS